jgi:hypothetical protein
VDDRIPGGSLILLAGKPKAGKSTLARSLAFCVAAGEPWLGHHVVMGPVWYLALEDKRSEVRRHFRAMGATGQEPLWMLVGQAPENCIALLEERAKHEKPVLIIVDTLQRLIQAKDMNDYAEVTTKFSPLLKLCRETGSACVVLHHANKFGEGIDCILGSSALSGSVDNIFIMGRGEHERTLQSIQRIGDDLESTVVNLDEHGHVSLAGSKRDAEIQRAADLIIEALKEEADTRSERWIREQVESAPKSQAQALRMMLRRGWVYRIGEGKRGNPYTYGIADQGSTTRKPEYVPHAQRVSAENCRKVAGNQNPPLCPKPPTPESSSTDRYVHRSTGTDGNVVSLVLATSENGNGNGHERLISLSSATRYSGFSTPETAEDVDDSLFANPDDDSEVA